MKAFIAYAEKIPAAAAQIKANLKLPLPATFVKYGTAGFGGFADYYKGDAKAAFASVEDEALQKQFDEAAQKAGAAMTDLAEYVGSQPGRSEEHTSELQSLMRISSAVFCLKKKNKKTTENYHKH